MTYLVMFYLFANGKVQVHIKTDPSKNRFSFSPPGESSQFRKPLGFHTKQCSLRTRYPDNLENS